MNDLFSRVLVINLDRRPDRLERFAASLADWPFVRPQRSPATDGSTTAPPDGWAGRPGAFGCWDSHCRLLESIDPAATAPVLILEDDAMFSPDFAAGATEFLSAVGACDPEWELLFLGGEHYCTPQDLRPPEPVAPGVIRCRRTGRTHCYAVRPAFAPVLAAHWRGNLDAIDVTLWPWARDRRVYSPQHWLAGQSGGPSDITQVRHRDRWFGADHWTR